MTTFRIKISVLVFCLFPLIAYSWSETGHVLIAQIAYDQLNAQKKQKADELATLIFHRFKTRQQQILNAQYVNMSTFAKIAALPDAWRKQKLKSIFKRFHAELPPNLMSSSNESTYTWHYIDIPFPANTTSCVFMDLKNIVWAIENISFNLEMTRNRLKNSSYIQGANEFNNAYALQMVFLEHFIGDIHQPLHTETNIADHCSGDRGGNEFCLKKDRGKCISNLHGLWDSGAGYLKSKKDIGKMVYELEKTYPPAQFEKELKTTDPRAWSKINAQQISFIYNTPQLSSPSQEYLEKGQSIAKQQIALAAYRLAQEMEKIL